MFLVGWLMLSNDRFLVCLNGWWVDGLMGWSVGCLVGCLVGCMVEWLVG